MTRKGTFQKGNVKGGEAAKSRTEKKRNFKKYVADKLKIERDSLIIDHIYKMMTSKDDKDRTKVVELILKNLDPDIGEPGAIDAEVLTMLREFDARRREGFGIVKGN